MGIRRLELRLKKLLLGVLIVNTLLSVGFSILTLTQKTWVPNRAEAAQEIAQDVTSLERLETLSMEQVSSATTGKAIFRTYHSAEGKVVNEAGRYQLMGISSRNGQLRAFIKDMKLNRAFSVGTGETLGVFLVVSVEKDGIRLQKGSDEYFLKRR